MLIFYKERLAFLSVPKTGTTAYETALRDRADMVISVPAMLKHAPVCRLPCTIGGFDQTISRNNKAWNRILIN